MQVDRRSLTLRLTLLFGLASTVVLVLIGYGFYLALGMHFLHEDAIELRGKTELLGNLVGRLQTRDDLDALRTQVQDALVGHHNLSIVLRTSDGRTLYAGPDAHFTPEASALRVYSSDEIEGLVVQSAELGEHRFRLARTTLAAGLPGMPRIDAILGMNIDHHYEFMQHVRTTILIAIVAGALLSGLLGWLAARIGIAPLRAFSSLTSSISAERLSTRIAVDELPPELEQLGRSFNAMLTRLEESFTRLQEFSSDLAHELRTPISALMTQAQVTLSRARSETEYREVIYAALEEYDRLARMITDMLFLAKADRGLLVPERETVDLRAEVTALFEFYDALVESRGIKLASSGSGSATGDRLMIRRALGNLLSNAVRHATSGSTVRVDIAPDGDKYVSISVTNEGAAIPPEHLPRLFDRFYRVDASRERSTEGAGLGLSITKTIIDAHAGTISARSGEGLTSFQMRLPCA